MGGDLVGRSVGDFPPVQDHRSPFGLHDSGDGFEQGGLPGPVGAQQGHDGPFFDLEVHVEEHLYLAVADLEVSAQQDFAVAPSAGQEYL